MISWAVFTPHPPLLVPEIGGSMLERVADTKQSLEKLFEEVDSQVDSLVVMTPHSHASVDKVMVSSGKQLEGRLAQFGGAKKLTFKVDRSLSQFLITGLEEAGLPAQLKALPDGSAVESIDHGAYVPLYYAEQVMDASPDLTILNPGLFAPDKIWKAGKVLGQRLENEDKRIGVIISGDLSHKLSRNAPAGYHPRAHLFDQQVKEWLEAKQPNKLLEVDQELLAEAGECGYRPLIMGSSLVQEHGYRNCRVLSYEAPFGVGYLVARIL